MAPAVLSEGLNSLVLKYIERFSSITCYLISNIANVTFRALGLFGKVNNTAECARTTMYEALLVFIWIPRLSGFMRSHLNEVRRHAFLVGVSQHLGARGHIDDVCLGIINPSFKS